jgi:hypothetical protein
MLFLHRYPNDKSRFSVSTDHDSARVVIGAGQESSWGPLTALGVFLWPGNLLIPKPSPPTAELREPSRVVLAGSVHDNAHFRSLPVQVEMLTSRLLGIFAVVSALVSPGAEFAVARDAQANDFSPLLEWENQIAADIEHNKRYLPGVRTRAKSALCTST